MFVCFYFGENNDGFNVVWREFIWGTIVRAFGEGMMHPIDTLKNKKFGFATQMIDKENFHMIKMTA